MLAICVVYLTHEAEGLALLDFSIAQIRRVTAGPYRIHGCCPGNDAATMRRLAHQGVVVHEAPPRHQHISQEHAQLLNCLVDRAVDDGCTHVAAFDMDSWPVLPGWDARYASIVGPATPVASIVRTELGDNFPFAAFTFFGADFWRRGTSSFSVLQRGPFGDHVLNLSSRPTETGSGILAQLHDENRGFLRLERSNARNIHPVIAGLYDNAIFHLGAGSRAPRFITDDLQYNLDGTPLLNDFAGHMNAAAKQFALAQILSRHDDFVRDLTGGIGPLRPIATDPRTLPSSLPLTPLKQRDLWHF
jgi:hypothetical protein